MGCEFPTEFLGIHKVFGLVIACSAIFMYFFMLLFTGYYHQKQKLKYIDWDVKAITAADYSVEFDISETMYLNFLENYFDQTNPLSELA